MKSQTLTTRRSEVRRIYAIHDCGEFDLIEYETCNPDCPKCNGTGFIWEGPGILPGTRASLQCNCDQELRKKSEPPEAA
jgi:hypothetical protein